ncbi:MAG: glycosyltransferase [Bacteroidia bacterium]|nr:glycosyltransferase [Bacteroidia bacterium]
MGKIKRVAIYFRDNPRWTGGVYYLQNLIKAVHTIQIPENIEIRVICCEEKELDMLRELNNRLPVEFIPKSTVYQTHRTWERVINRISRLLLNRNSIRRDTLINRYAGSSDWVYPAPEPEFFNTIPGRICWIPDLQHKALPEFFSAEELNRREETIRQYIVSKHPLVFSSIAARNDFITYYTPGTLSLHVLNFAVYHPSLGQLDPNRIVEKYNITQPFVYAPNQFWKHKDHISVIEAVSELVKGGEKDLLVLFSGNEHDYRFPGYTDTLKQRVKELGLTANIRFLGFLPRENQLVLMKRALFILQPSLFEGWSTVVEDAKALDKHVLASDLPVHREQLGSAASYFPAGSVPGLAEALLILLKGNIPKHDFQYEHSRKRFATDFLEIVTKL